MKKEYLDLIKTLLDNAEKITDYIDDLNETEVTDVTDLLVDFLTDIHNSKDVLRKMYEDINNNLE
jgi:Asp-tRNA(Asn)/Glu-tRNA(Gln) amidotransferase C subunit